MSSCLFCDHDTICLKLRKVNYTNLSLGKTKHEVITHLSIQLLKRQKVAGVYNSTNNEKTYSHLHARKHLVLLVENKI